MMFDDLISVDLGGGYQLTTFASDTAADAWLTGCGKPGTPYGIGIADLLPLELHALGSEPRLCFDYRNQPYIVWPCGRSALVWRCEQRSTVWRSPALDRVDARAP